MRMLFTLLLLVRLAPTTLDSFLAESELIVEASPRQLTRKELGAGEATLSVLRVHRGAFTEKEITIRWGTEVHDQHIDSIDHDYLLFLKRGPEGGWIPAQYGRSYWPFTFTVVDPSHPNLDHESRGFWFDHPLTMLTLTPAQSKTLFDSTRSEGKRQFLSMKRLMTLLNEPRK